MELFYESPDGRAKLYLGDVIEAMAQFPDACVDAILTDPPYGLEFMGKEWDRFKETGEFKGGGHGEGTHPAYGAWDNKPSFYHRSPEEMQAYQSWTTAWATEAYRVLKPGAYMLVMGGTRTHHRLGCGLEDAGFKIRDELAWIYASGFPKNYDVSKGIDKRAGAERTKVRKRDKSGATCFSPDKGWHEHHMGGEYELKEAVTPEAQYWEGYGTALKPAHEPIWLCKKPNEGTYVDNVLEHGCGAMNIEGSRIHGQMGDGVWGSEQVDCQSTFNASPDNPQYRTEPHIVRGKTPGHFQPGSGEAKKDYRQVVGRWPANVLVECYPEKFQGGVVIERSNWEKERGQDGLLGPYYTHYFVIPKPSKAEKNKGCTELYYRKVKGGHTRINREEWEELVAEEERIEKETGKRKTLQARGNIHVTVKPVRLGMWLIKLITPHQHPVVVADLFCGSGSFLVSGVRLNQEQGYQIQMWGIDKDKDSLETARARVEMAKKRLLQARLL